jgi:hypothetical protein
MALGRTGLRDRRHQHRTGKTVLNTLVNLETRPFPVPVSDEPPASMSVYHQVQTRLR